MHNAQAKSRSVKNYLISLEETAKYKPGVRLEFAVKSASHAQVWEFIVKFHPQTQGCWISLPESITGLLWSLSKCQRLNLICSGLRRSPCFKSNLRAEDLDYIESNADVIKSFCLSQMKLAARFSQSVNYGKVSICSQLDFRCLQAEGGFCLGLFMPCKIPKKQEVCWHKRKHEGISLSQATLQFLLGRVKARQTWE